MHNKLLYENSSFNKYFLSLNTVPCLLVECGAPNNFIGKGDTIKNNYCYIKLRKERSQKFFTKYEFSLQNYKIFLERIPACAHPQGQQI